MKIRNGFVSNSSSSSFTVRLKLDKELDEDKPELYEDLIKVAINSMFDLFESNIKEMRQEYLDNYKDKIYLCDDSYQGEFDGCLSINVCDYFYEQPLLEGLLKGIEKIEIEDDRVKETYFE